MKIYLVLMFSKKIATFLLTFHKMFAINFPGIKVDQKKFPDCTFKSLFLLNKTQPDINISSANKAMPANAHERFSHSLTTILLLVSLVFSPLDVNLNITACFSATNVS